MIIQHNIQAMFNNRQLNIIGGEKTDSMRKLSSGYRINQAADDAAGLAISEKMRKQIRGLTQAVANAEDGISLIQTADGALAEVHEILQRMNELCVQAANGTNSATDRGYIQDEIDQLKTEVDRVATTTKFNEIYLLNGSIGKKTRYTATTTTSTPMNGMSFSQVNALDGLKLIYTEIKMSDFRLLPDEYSYDAATKTWSRSFAYNTNISGTDVAVKLVQKVQIDDADKNYIITNSIGVKSDTSTGYPLYGFDFMMNIDTAYSNDDECEAYYANGSEIATTRIYETAAGESHLSKEMDETLADVYPESEYPSSISIANAYLEGSLPFSEKITFLSGSDAPVISIGDFYGNSTKWSYYDNNNSNDPDRNESTADLDKTLSLIWSLPPTVTGLSILNQMATGRRDSYSFTFKYGIEDIKADTNLPTSTPIKYITYQVPDYDADPITVKRAENNILKIQAGASSLRPDGIFIKLVDATASGLGINMINSRNEDESINCITKISEAINRVSKYRSYFGAVQNRLEHAYNINQNTVENTQYAESQIRDTDMAKEMVNNSNISILAQAGQSMLAQAKQSNQGVLSLIA